MKAVIRRRKTLKHLWPISVRTAVGAQSQSPRAYSTSAELSHIDPVTVQPTMVDVSAKAVTLRIATAESTVLFPPSIARLLVYSNNSVELTTAKGSVIQTAIVAGTAAVKQTSSLIPFCHSINISHIKFHMKTSPIPSQLRHRIDTNTDEWSALHIACTVKCEGRTGVEMEALTGCSIAALTVYDMTKALSHDTVIAETRLTSKSGGKSEYVRCSVSPIHSVPSDRT